MLLIAEPLHKFVVVRDYNAGKFAPGCIKIPGFTLLLSSLPCWEGELSALMKPLAAGRQVLVFTTEMACQKMLEREP